MHIELVVVVLFAIATAVALIARRLQLPYTVALVVAGLVFGAGNWVPAPHLSRSLLFAVFLPGLIFEAAFHIEAKRFWADRLTIFGLALPGVLASIATTAFILWPAVQGFHLEYDFQLIDGMVFGGIIAATDPIAVISLFRSLNAPRRLGVLVEGESLLNDGTAVVFFGVILTLASGAPVTAGGVAFDFLRTCGLGVLVGLGLGFAGSRVIHWVDDPMIEITTTVVMAWGSFAVAEEINASGVLATVTAGILCGNYGARTGMSPSTKIAVHSFWSYLAFALNSMVFLLMGFEVQLGGVIAAWPTVLLAWLATTLARAVVVALVTLLMRRSRERLPPWWGTVMCWGGVRGSVSMVLALALPFGLPHRQFLIDVVFGVVLVSILVQGTTMGWLLRRLGILSHSRQVAEYQHARADGLAARAGLEELDRLQQNPIVPAELLKSLRGEYEARIAAADARIDELHLNDTALAREEQRRLRRRLILAEKDRILSLIQQGLSSGEAASDLLTALDARLVELHDRSGE
jgi:CPA1 family monovalent cation:H+ antiporter